jgi:hypothetical protein
MPKTSLVFGRFFQGIPVKISAAAILFGSFSSKEKEREKWFRPAGTRSVLVNRPSLRLLPEKNLRLTPNSFEQFAVAVIFKIGFGIPFGDSEKNRRSIYIALQLQRSATGKRSDAVFIFVKYLQEGINFIREEIHLYETCQHWVQITDLYG